MRPFSTLKIEYTDKSFGDKERQAIFSILADSKYAESSNFVANPNYSLVFFKGPFDVIKALRRRPQPGVKLSVYLDDLSKTFDPHMLIVETKPNALKGRAKGDIEECNGKIVGQIEKNNGQFNQICDFGSFHKCAIAYEKLYPHYFLSFKKLGLEDIWKHSVMSDLSENCLRKENENISCKVKEMEADQTFISPTPPKINNIPECDPPTPYKKFDDRKFKFYVRVPNDSSLIFKLDEFVHELEGFKCSWIMDSKSDPKYRYFRVEFETNEQTEDAYNLMQLFPVETKTHYFMDFIKEIK